MLRASSLVVSQQARTATDVQTLAFASIDLAQLDADISDCRACPRLVEWREQVATRASVARSPTSTYWGRPVPGLARPVPDVLIVGLAPAAHGANRTGRMFTGDRSGDWLYASLHRVGLANQAAVLDSTTGCASSTRASLPRCVAHRRRTSRPRSNAIPAPVARSPSLRSCEPHVRAIVALGLIWLRSHARPCSARAGFDDAQTASEVRSWSRGRRSVRSTVLGCYHPSQQNTFTGKLTEPMLDAVLRRAA